MVGLKKKEKCDSVAVIIAAHITYSRVMSWHIVVQAHGHRYTFREIPLDLSIYFKAPKYLRKYLCSLVGLFYARIISHVIHRLDIIYITEGQTC